MSDLDSRKLERRERWRHQAIVSGLQAVTNRRHFWHLGREALKDAAERAERPLTLVAQKAAETTPFSMPW